MRAFLIGASIVALTTLGIATAASAAEFNCEALRQACMMKGSLGEGGKGNCKAYRNSGCANQRPNFGGGGGGGGVIIGGGGMGGGGFGPGAGRCFKLQQACANKDALGLNGMGVCRTFRNECT